MESQPQNPEFRHNSENFYPRIYINLATFANCSSVYLGVICHHSSKIDLFL